MAWKRTRAFPTSIRLAILRRDPTCMGCGVAPSVVADHVAPASEGGTDSIDNGQGLCRSCHDVKTKAETARGIARYQAERPTQRRRPEAHPGMRE